MKRKFSLLLSLVLPLTSFAVDMPLDMAPPISQNGEDVEIENRILLKVNKKAISVLDIVRKMDLLFYRQYPELISQSSARLQFYMASWQKVLQMVIDEELMIADARREKN